MFLYELVSISDWRKGWTDAYNVSGRMLVSTVLNRTSGRSKYGVGPSKQRVNLSSNFRSKLVIIVTIYTQYSALTALF
jgi:hypothetical protein